MSAFTVYPAIDLRRGRVVRLAQGDPERETVYGDDPAAVAERWLAAGATWLHVVNLDGAFGEGGQANLEALRALLATGALIQFGGGLRSLPDVEAALEAGVARVVLGTAAVEAPDLVAEALARFGPDRVAVALDVRAGRVQVRGWVEDAGREPVDLAAELAGLGLRTVVHTDVARDGVSRGLNVEASKRLAEATGLEVIASGGVASLADIQAARKAGLAGVVVGRALYDGRFTLEEALRC